jgi:putative DNA primase/helicase
MDKITTATTIVASLRDTVYCNGLYYFFNNDHFVELSDSDFSKIVRKYFIRNKMTDMWSTSISKDIVSAMKLEIADESEKDIMDYSSNHIPIKNGIVDLSDPDNVKIIPHDPSFLFTYILPVTWNPSSQHKEPANFLKFLKGTFRNRDGTINDDSIESVLYVFAYIIYPAITMEKIFMFLGDGANGKSLFISIMKMFFKPDHVTYASLQTLSDDQSNNRDFLLNSRLNIAGEQKGIKIDPEEIKKIASGQALQIILRYKGNFSFKPKVKLVVDSNNLPYFADNTRGTKRRLYIVNFYNNFLEDDDYLEQQRILSGCDTNAKENEYNDLDLSRYGLYRQSHSDSILKSIESEMDDIFNLLIIYIHKLKVRNWQLPKNKETDKAMQKYEEGTDYLKGWLLKKYKKDESLHDDTGTTASSIYQSFNDDYIDEFGKAPLHKKNTITKRIAELFKDEGKRINIKMPDGTRRKDKIFKLSEIINF